MRIQQLHAFLWILLFLFSCSLLFSAGNTQEIEPPEITVRGTASIMAAPDIATVRMGIEMYGEDVEALYKGGAERMAQVVNMLKAEGIPPEAIQTSHLQLDYQTPSSSPASSVRPGQQLPDENSEYYRMVHLVSVRLKNIERIAYIIKKATENGINRIGDIQFSLGNPEKYNQAVRREAVENARLKAEQIAAPEELVPGKVISIREGSGSSPFARVSASSFGIERGGISPGELEISLTVDIIYELIEKNSKN